MICQANEVYFNKFNPWGSLYLATLDAKSYWVKIKSDLKHLHVCTALSSSCPFASFAEAEQGPKRYWGPSLAHLIVNRGPRSALTKDAKGRKSRVKTNM